MMGKDKNKDKEPQDGEIATSKTVTSPQDTCQSNRDLSQDCDAWDTALAKTITKTVAREMAKAHAHYQALLNERCSCHSNQPLSYFRSKWFQGYGAL